MKTAYNYLLFRIYRFYKDRHKETGRTLLFSVAIVSSSFILINSLIIYFNLEQYDLVPGIPNELYIIGYSIFILCCNYFFIVRKKNFLNYNFQKDKLGGYLIILSLLVSALFFMLVVNQNSERIEKRKKSAQIENIN